jgi:protein-disulfide isomerase
MGDKYLKVGLVILVVGLVAMSFGMGTLFQKVQYLEKGQTLGAAGGQSPQPAVYPTQAPVDPKKLAEVGNKGFSKGNVNAKVTVVEFADYQCPYCEQFFTQVTTPLIKDYVDTGKVRFVYRDYAFLGQESGWAAEATRCANDQGKYWQFHDYLFSHQKGENQGAFSKDNLKIIAKTLKLNTTQFNSCLDSGKYTAEVAQDLADGQAVGVNGTPASFINGKMLNGAQPYETFKAAIEEELKK